MFIQGDKTGNLQQEPGIDIQRFSPNPAVDAEIGHRLVPSGVGCEMVNRKGARLMAGRNGVQCRGNLNHRELKLDLHEPDEIVLL